MESVDHRWRIVHLIMVVIASHSFLPPAGAAGLDYTIRKYAVTAPPVAIDFVYVNFARIIVGGGTPGCSLAATLSLDYSVLFLETGSTFYGNPDIENASNFGKFIYSIRGNTWLSRVQSFQSQDGVFKRRARALGGGSAINAGFDRRDSNDYVSRACWDVGMVAAAGSWVEAAIVAYFPPIAAGANSRGEFHYWR